MNENKNTKPIANVVGAGPVSARDPKGITLVALIITIIVMLILVGVSITIAIKGGLFGTTKRAAKETEEAKRKEQELASGRIKIDGIWYDSLEDYAIGKQSAVQGIVDLDERNTKFIYKPEGWTNGEVKVEIDASAVASGYFLKYSTDNINWNDYATEIPMSENGAIYAKLVDSDGNEGGAITANVRNIDKTAPTINTDLSGGETTDTTIPLSITVTDNVSGISKIEWYYKLNSESEYTKLTDTYIEMNGKEAGEKETVTKEKTLTGLKDNSTYNIYAEVYDVAGNHKRSPETGTIDITTKIKPKLGDKIEYEPDTVSTPYSLEGKYSGYGDYDSSTTPYTLTTPRDQSISQEELTWQVLKVYDDGRIDLIGTPTEQTVYFGGAIGYNNGVYLLHDICKELYSKESAGIVARSVSLEDFEDEDNGGSWKSARDAYTGRLAQFGNSKTYTDNRYTYYPNLYAEENGSGINTTSIKTNGIKGTNKYYTSPTSETYSKAENNGLTVTQTYYYIAIDEANYGNVAKVLSNSNAFWLASRAVYLGSPVAIFDLFCSREMTHMDFGMCSSGGNSISKDLTLRPVVSLGADSQLSLKTEGTGGMPNTFEITKY